MQDELEDDFDDEQDFDDWQSEPTDNCPECGAPVDNDLDQCPRCGFYILDEDIPESSSKKRTQTIIVVVMAILILAPFLLWLLQLLLAFSA